MISCSVSGNVEREESFEFKGTLSKSRERLFQWMKQFYPSPTFYETSGFKDELKKLKDIFTKGVGKRFKLLDMDIKYEELESVKYLEVFNGRIHHDNCTRVYVVISNEGIGFATGCFLGGGNPRNVTSITKLDNLIKECERDYSWYADMCNGL